MSSNYGWFFFAELHEYEAILYLSAFSFPRFSFFFPVFSQDASDSNAFAEKNYVTAEEAPSVIRRRFREPNGTIRT